MWLKNSLIIHKEKTKEINDKGTANFTSKVLDQGNPKSKY